MSRKKNILSKTFSFVPTPFFTTFDWSLLCCVCVCMCMCAYVSFSLHRWFNLWSMKYRCSFLHWILYFKQRARARSYIIRTAKSSTWNAWNWRCAAAAAAPFAPIIFHILYIEIKSIENFNLLAAVVVVIVWLYRVLMGRLVFGVCMCVRACFIFVCVRECWRNENPYIFFNKKKEIWKI